GIHNVQLDVSCTGEPHAPLHLHARSPRRDSPRALPPSAPARAAEDGSRLAQEPRLHARGHRPPGRRLTPQRPTLSRRVRRRRLATAPTLALEGQGQRTRCAPSLPGGLLRGAPPALDPRSAGRHRPTNRRPPRLDPGARLFKKTLGL